MRSRQRKINNEKKKTGGGQAKLKELDEVECRALNAWGAIVVEGNPVGEVGLPVATLPILLSDIDERHVSEHELDETIEEETENEP